MAIFMKKRKILGLKNIGKGVNQDKDINQVIGR